MVDSVGQVQHILQHTLRLVRELVDTVQVTDHLIQAKGRVEQNIAGLLRNPGSLALKMFKDIFKVMAQSRYPTQSDNRRRAFEGVRNALGRHNVRAISLAGGHVTRQFNQIARLIRSFLKKPFKQFLVYIVGHHQSNIFGCRQNRTLRLSVTFTGQRDLQWHGAKHVHHFHGLFLVHRARRATQVIHQARRGRRVTEVSQVMDHQRGPRPEEGKHRTAFFWRKRCQQQAVLQDMGTHALQAWKSCHLGGLAHALSLPTVLIECIHERRILDVERGQFIQVLVKLGPRPLDLRSERVYQVFELHESCSFWQLGAGCRVRQAVEA